MVRTRELLYLAAPAVRRNFFRKGARQSPSAHFGIRSRPTMGQPGAPVDFKFR
jgi:hypothetical protein